MIFKTKRAFENAVYERMSEIDFRAKTEEKLYRLEEEVNSLKHNINRLADTLNMVQRSYRTGGDTDAPTM